MIADSFFALLIAMLQILLVKNRSFLAVDPEMVGVFSALLSQWVQLASRSLASQF